MRGFILLFCQALGAWDLGLFEGQVCQVQDDNGAICRIRHAGSCLLDNLADARPSWWGLSVVLR